MILDLLALLVIVCIMFLSVLWMPISITVVACILLKYIVHVVWTWERWALFIILFFFIGLVAAWLLGFPLHWGPE